MLNPEYTGMLNKVLFIDIDTFVIQNLDEVFCAPHRAAAERPLPPGVTKRPPSRNFNGGVFQVRSRNPTTSRCSSEMASASLCLAMGRGARGDFSSRPPSSYIRNSSRRWWRT